MNDLGPEPVTGSHPVTKRELERELNLNEIKTVVSIALTVLGGGFAGYTYIITEARAAGDAGVAVLSAKHEDLRREVIRYEEVTDGSIKGLMGDVREVSDQVKETQSDIRSLYKAMMTGRPQERLEKPFDGGR